MLRSVSFRIKNCNRKEAKGRNINFLSAADTQSICIQATQNEVVAPFQSGGLAISTQCHQFILRLGKSQNRQCSLSILQGKEQEGNWNHFIGSPARESLNHRLSRPSSRLNLNPRQHRVEKIHPLQGEELFNATAPNHLLKRIGNEFIQNAADLTM
jgi:hypothetical protein